MQSAAALEQPLVKRSDANFLSCLWHWHVIIIWRYCTVFGRSQDIDRPAITNSSLFFFSFFLIAVLLFFVFCLVSIRRPDRFATHTRERRQKTTFYILYIRALAKSLHSTQLQYGIYPFWSCFVAAMATAKWFIHRPRFSLHTPATPATSTVPAAPVALAMVCSSQFGPTLLSKHKPPTNNSTLSDGANWDRNV